MDAAAKSERRKDRKRAELFGQGAEVALLLLRDGVVFAAQRDSEGERARCVEAARRLLEADKAGEKKTGAEEQDERERDFDRDKYVASLVLTAAGGEAARAFAESVVDISARGKKRGQDTTQQSRGDRNGDDKEKHSSIEVCGCRAWKRVLAPK